MSELWIEAWTRPGDPNFGRIFDYLPTQSYGFNDGVNRVGGGDAKIARSFGGFADLLSLDRSDLSLSKSSLIRVYSERDLDNPIMEWLPESRVPAESKDDPNVEMIGSGIKSILRYARTEAFDWDGTNTFISRDPDWIYGGNDQIRNGGLEDEPLGISNQGFEDGTREPWWPGAVEGVSANMVVQSVVVDTGSFAAEVTPLLPEGGASTTFSVVGAKEYVVTARFQGAAGIDYQIGCSGPDNIQATAPAVVAVHSDGGTYGPGHNSEAQLTFTASGAWETITLTFTTAPGQRISQVSLREAEVVLNGSPFYIDVVTVTGYGIGVEPWEPTDVERVTTFEASNAQAFTGSWSLDVTAETGHGAIQRLQGIKPGVTYTATITIGHASAASTWVLEARDVQGNLLGQASATIGVGAWTELSITFTVPDFLPGSSGQITVGAINYDGATRSAFVDDLVFYRGMLPDTIGKILGDLYDDATTDHAPARVVWEDEAVPGTTYLTKDFTDALDSAGQPWDVDDRSMRITMRMDLGMVMDRAASDWGYEYRIVPDDPEAGSWLWQVYNPGTMSVDHTTSARPAVQGGADDVEAQPRTFAPDGTDILVEGLARITARSRSAALMAAFGRIEASRIDRELPSGDAITAAAVTERENIQPGMLDYVYVFTGDLQDEPLSDYDLGDELAIHDPPEVEDTGRFLDVTVTVNPDETRWECHYLPNAEDVSS